MKSKYWLLLGLSLLSLGLVPRVGQTIEQRPGNQTVDWRMGSFPVENFQGYTSPFGYRRSATGGPNTEFHSGLDFAAPEGSYIRNWWTGRVIEVSDNTACGTSLRIQSGSWIHVYCHLKGRVEQDSRGQFVADRAGGIQIWEGQTIPSGARIGRVGMTGRTTGPHLHWTLKYAGQLVNPAIVLQAMYASQSQPQLLSRQAQGEAKNFHD
uniref:Peptidase M23 n=1 Tax=Cyanothece sp. (strain PCC 7425 / ATCC 29141) TaxID=395961 RepID=B8HJU9_CYAP4